MTSIVNSRAGHNRLSVSRYVAAFILCLTLPAPVNAAKVFFGGNELYELIADGSTWDDATFTGYVAGFVDSNSGLGVCPELPITLDDTSNKAKTYLRDHPGDRHFSAPSLLLEAFPECTTDQMLDYLNADAQFYSGNELLRLYQQGGIGRSLVIGYVVGVHDGVAWIDDLPLGDGGKDCSTPDNVTINQVRDISMKYIRENPADRHMLGSSLVQKALLDAFPCR